MTEVNLTLRSGLLMGFHAASKPSRLPRGGQDSYQVISCTR